MEEEDLSRIPGEPESRREDNAPALAYKSRRRQRAQASTSNHQSGSIARRSRARASSSPRLHLPGLGCLLCFISSAPPMASVLPETASDGKALTDAWDYKGRPASRATTGGWGCAAMILGTPIYLPLRFQGHGT